MHTNAMHEDARHDDATDADPTPEAAAPILSAIEARILGSLLEKQATTPETYPLTLNALVLACNQKTAREPVMQLEPGQTGHALRQLETRGWVKSAHAGRVDRYEQRVDTKLDLNRAQAALLGLLMLRGAQTINELRTRAERLASFGSDDDVLHALDRMAQREPGLVVRVGRQGGQREDRYAHLLCGEPVVSFDSAPSRGESAGGPALVDRVAALEARIARLEAALGVTDNSAEAT